mmetsp:Transcript_2073/g.5030  ORF Transcript_2073/g.5030 Transcript_2073/m.5030 type:complete len:343 (-) Transcript_2073:195-1223(-)
MGTFRESGIRASGCHQGLLDFVGLRGSLLVAGLGLRGQDRGSERERLFFPLGHRRLLAGARPNSSLALRPPDGVLLTLNPARIGDQVVRVLQISESRCRTTKWFPLLLEDLLAYIHVLADALLVEAAATVGAGHETAVVPISGGSAGQGGAARIGDRGASGRRDAAEVPARPSGLPGGRAQRQRINRGLAGGGDRRDSCDARVAPCRLQSSRGIPSYTTRRQFGGSADNKTASCSCPAFTSALKRLGGPEVSEAGVPTLRICRCCRRGRRRYRRLSAFATAAASAEGPREAAGAARFAEGLSALVPWRGHPALAHLGLEEHEVRLSRANVLARRKPRHRRRC